MFSSIFKKSSPLDALISPAYLAEITERHQREPYWGTGGEHYAERIAKSIGILKAQSFLDYGCGKCALLMELQDGEISYTIDPEVMLEGYDPAIDGFTELPQPADFVACLNVLEYVEADKRVNVIEHLASVTTIAALIAIDTSKAELSPSEWVELTRPYFIIGHVQMIGDQVILEASPWSDQMHTDLGRQRKLYTLAADRPAPIPFNVTLGKVKREK